MDISVIIPIYNVEKYLMECLISVCRNVKDLDAEVILVDDGSTDQSSRIASEYAEDNHQFVYFRKENGGLSDARNYGVSKARGKYIFFVDSDDMLTDGILKKMLEAAEKNQTDLTTCNVARLRKLNAFKSNLFEKGFFHFSGNVTHVRKDLNLIYDSTSWNKLIRRDFWLKYKFAFPVGYTYEDIPTIFPVHYLANAVSVIPETGYLWRVRTGNDKSISQNRDQVAYLEDKIEMMRRLIAFLKENVPEKEIRDAVQVKFLNIDFYNFLNVTPELNDEITLQYVKLIRKFVRENIDSELISQCTYITKQVLYDVEQEDIEHLRKVITYKKEQYAKAVIEKKDGQFVMQVPEDLFYVEQGPIQNEFLYVPPSCSIDDVIRHDAEMKIRGHLYDARIELKTAQTLSVSLYNEMTGERTLLNTAVYIPEDRDILCETVGEKTYDYKGTGFEICLSTDELCRTVNEKDTYLILLDYSNDIGTGECYLRVSNDPGIALISSQYCRDGDTVIRFQTDPTGILKIFRQKTEKDIISVIIPVYNAGAYLQRTLSCMAAQTYFNLEVLLMDDASSDGSGELCDSYALNDDRFRVFHLEHGGVAKARNTALELFTGDYFMFADADDPVSYRYAERLHEIAEEMQEPLVTCMAKDVKEFQKMVYTCYDLRKPKVYTLDQYDYMKNYSHRVIWGAIYRRDILGEIRFREEYNVSTDTLFFAEILKKQGHLVHLQEHLYCYVKYSESIAHGRFNRNRYSDLLVWQKVAEIFADSPEKIRDSSRTREAVHSINALKKLALDDNPDKVLIADVKKHLRFHQRAVLKSSLGRKKKLLNVLFMTFPGIAMKVYAITKK